jgi:hypothetical protein
MHNGGTNRLILPQKGPVLGSTHAPAAGINVAVIAGGVQLTVFVGETRIPMTLGADQATVLGVTIIKAAALSATVGPIPQGPPPELPCT